MENQKFSFVNFYMNRAKRLLPALCIVLLSTFCFSYYFLLENEFSTLGKHIMASVGFFQNINLLLESGYFDISAKLKPLLHIWSLGVEEQFYIIFPLIVFFSYKFFSRKYFILLICLIAIISYILNIVFFKFGLGEYSYYLPITRFFQILLGCILGYIVFYKKISFSSSIASLMSLIGLLGILISLIIVDDTSYAGYKTLLPAVSAFLIIGAGKSGYLNKLLSNRYFVFLGLISYPLYLWHWPILSFANIAGGGGGNL